MKLWQKVFLYSLTMVVFAVGLTAAWVLVNNHLANIERERNNAIAKHSHITYTLQSNVAYERLRQDKLLISDAELFKLINALYQSSDFTQSGFALYNSNKEQVFNSRCMATAENLQLLLSKSSDTYSIIQKEGGKTFFIVSSSIAMNGSSYVCFSSYDITPLYDDFNHQLHIVKIASVGFAVVIGLILLIMSLFLLLPLGRVNATLKKVAQGEYKLRLEEKGSAEFRELSSNVNQMACAIDNNVTHLQAIAESRKRFANDLAHEMKTPLTSILGFGDLLRIKRSLSDEERIEFSTVIVDEANRLRILSGKLLELAASEEMVMDIKPVPVCELVNEICTAQQPFINKRGLALSQECEDIIIDADKVLLQSLLSNLIDNAAKASSPGQTIRLTSFANEGNIIFSVSDDGIGMSEDDIAMATEPFHMADKSRSRQNGGVGLGLSLCVEIAKRHGGSLSIESVKGSGTTVTVSCPLKTEVRQ